MNNPSSSETDEECAQNVKTTRTKSANRSHWVNPNNSQREELGEYSRIMNTLEEDPSKYDLYFRMNKNEFNFVHSLIETDIRKRNTQLRKAIGSKERLVICLRFLVTGNPFRTIGSEFRLGNSTVRVIVKEVCESIWKRLSPIVMPKPSEQKWLDIAKRYEELWKFPNCIGSIVGKSIKIKCPINTSSPFYNYNGDNTTVLVAMIDADCKFIAIDVGSYGQNVEDSIFNRSRIGQCLEQGGFCIPQNGTTLNDTEYPMPYVLIGDATFPLKRYLLRPYSPVMDLSNEVFNMRVTHARQVVSNVFDMLFARWKIYCKPMMVQPDLVDIILLATCALHNFISGPVVLEATNPNDKSSIGDFVPLIETTTQETLQIREMFKDYFSSVTVNIA
ncbi:PREDICTED: putative nuclease HARBI1 [Nicrophorus vespilloides]|uniref:Nuclease HARBI1 n=1 Tax=Nicrophorus vespilloides TaxID=110193 RepID=A0ABM1N2D3_NICVS|nr:PREDICTED: putative nuclease HARBI1 [Nicrophorus vespilloides]